jgi:hypothetical protein
MLNINLVPILVKIPFRTFFAAAVSQPATPCNTKQKESAGRAERRKRGRQFFSTFRVSSARKKRKEAPRFV